MTSLYLDSSIVVSYAVRDSQRFSAIDELVRKSDLVLTCELAQIEGTAGILSQLRDQDNLLRDSAIQNLNMTLSRCRMIRISQAVLAEAKKLIIRHRIPLGLRSADSIHLAAWSVYCSHLTDKTSENFLFLTSDRKQFSAFTAEGHIGKFIV